MDKEKRKNEVRPRFQWWLLVVGVLIGAVAMLLVLQSRPQPVASSDYDFEGMELTATAIIQGATGTAQALGFGDDVDVKNTPELDPLMLTATVLAIEHATPEAGS